ncbi:hypothetical protein Dimus_028971, partial [Dionaea muscipula]
VGSASWCLQKRTLLLLLTFDVASFVSFSSSVDFSTDYELFGVMFLERRMPSIILILCLGNNRTRDC